MKRLFAIFLLLLLVSACSRTGDPESEVLEQDSTPAASEAGSEATSEAAVSTTPLLVVPTLPAGIAELPDMLWPTMEDPSPTAEDALKDYLLYHPSGAFGYQLVVGCQGLTPEANPNLMCARDPQISDRDGRQLYVYGVGRPPPEVSDYSIGIEGSTTEGWWILFGNIIAR